MAAPSSASPSDPGDATLLLHRLERGDAAAAKELLPLVYDQLRATAGSFFRMQSSDHTLQPTALVHEAYLKLVRTPEGRWQGQAHFCAVAATAMRQILQNHARDKRAEKRGGGAQRLPLTTIAMPSTSEPVDLLELDEALTELGGIDERGARIIELRFFGGLSNDEIADLLGTSRPTVERSWRRSRAWLKARLSGQREEGA